MNKTMTQKTSNLENYNMWVNSGNKLAKRHKSVAREPVKSGLEIKKTIDMATENSPEFKNKQYNNYDNSIGFIPRKMLENYHVTPHYNRKPSFKKMQLKDPSKFVSLGSTQGPGGRAVLYAAVPKSPYEKHAGKSLTEQKRFESKASLVSYQSSAFNKWNNYDTSRRNEIELQKKIVERKNYELDSRAHSL